MQILLLGSAMHVNMSHLNITQSLGQLIEITSTNIQQLSQVDVSHTFKLRSLGNLGLFSALCAQTNLTL